MVNRFAELCTEPDLARFSIYVYTKYRGIFKTALDATNR